MSLRNNIKLVLATLEKAIRQTPLDKQPLLAHKISKINEKYSKLNPQHNDPTYLKELEFNLNFVKLSFPYLDYSPPAQPKQPPPTQPQSNQVKPERVEQQFFELQDKEKVEKFMEETAKVLRGVREQVQFSNWGTGNVDPQDLKRHKQLLKRQHFAGQFWKDKAKPTSPTADYLMNVMQNSPQLKDQNIQVSQSEENATFTKDPDQNWEKVKR